MGQCPIRACQDRGLTAVVGPVACQKVETVVVAARSNCARKKSPVTDPQSKDLVNPLPRVTAREAIQLLSDHAEKLGADAADSNGLVRAVVTAHELGFDAWLCVCCELADRSARRQGYADQADRAAALAFPDARAGQAQHDGRTQSARVARPGIDDVETVATEPSP